MEESIKHLIDLTPVLYEDEGSIPIKPGGSKLTRYEDAAHTCGLVVPEGL